MQTELCWGHQNESTWEMYNQMCYNIKVGKKHEMRTLIRFMWLKIGTVEAFFSVLQ